MAFAETDELRKMKVLTKLSGVSIPTASALLSVTHPEKYPVIDIRCVATLQDLKKIRWTTVTYTSWISYLNAVRSIAKTGGNTARAVEKALFAYNRLKLDKDLKNLYL